MNQQSILSDASADVLDTFSKHPPESVEEATDTVNAVMALGLLSQLQEVCLACEGVYKDISNRLCDLNRRIGTAQKAVAECEQHLVSKQRHLYSVGVDELIHEHPSSFACLEPSPFDFLSIPKNTSAKRPTKPKPDLKSISKLIDDPVSADIAKEYSSMSQITVPTVHRRDITPTVKSEGEYRHSLSILSSIARLFAQKEPSARLSESFKSRYPSAVPTLSTIESYSPSTALPHSPSPSTPQPPSKTPSQPPSETPFMPVSTSSIQLSSETPSQPPSITPTETPSPQPQRAAKPPPPPSMPAGLARLSPISEDYQPPKPVQCKPPSVPPPIPIEALRPSPREPPKDVPKQEAPAQPPRPLPVDFLAAIRKAGTERQEKALQAAQDAQEAQVIQDAQDVHATHATQNTQDTQDTQDAHTTPSPLPAKPAASTPPSAPRSFLQEILQAGAARQNRVNSTATADTNSLGSRSGTIRRTGTLGGNSRVSERFGSDIMNDLHNEKKGTLRVQTEGEKPATPVPNTARKNLFDEIRHFDLAKLKRVTPLEGSQKEDVDKKEDGSVKPTVAELMHSRLMVMQSDSSSDSDDSRFEFSDSLVCFRKEGLWLFFI